MSDPYALEEEANNLAQDIDQSYHTVKNWLKRKYHPLFPRTHPSRQPPSVRPSGITAGITVSPIRRPARPHMPTMSHAASQTISHHMSDISHGTGMSNSNSSRGNFTGGLRCGQLYASRVHLPPPSTTDQEVNARANHIKLKGIKIHREFHTKMSTSNFNVGGTIDYRPGEFGYMGPMVINWALIQFKCQKDPGAEGGDVNIADALKPQFWNDDSGTTNWFAPYTEWEPNSNTVDPKDLFDTKNIYGSLCHHNDYRVLARKRMGFSQYLPFNHMNAKTTAVVHRYFKMPQRIYLEGGDINTWEHPIYEIWWATPINRDFLLNWPDTAGQNAVQFVTFSKNTVYFRDIKV